MPTTTIYAGTPDGHVRSRNATYSTARAGSTLLADDTSTTFTVGQRLAAGTYFLFEGFLRYDLFAAGLLSTDTVSAATLELYLTADNSTADFNLECRERDWGTSLTTTDWVAGGSLSGLTLLATLASSGIGSTGAFKAFTESGSNLVSAINTALAGDGVLKLILCPDNLTNNVAPTGDEYLVFSSADASGTSQDPKLSVTYTTAGEPFIAVIG